MLVTIEGVVDSDVCAQGAQHTVEWTKHLRGLVNSGLVKVIDWTPESLSAPEPAPKGHEPEKPAAVEDAPRPRARRRRVSEE
ncbi:hypothetical protein [Nocardia gipuzkoensis]|uniref:hypothetical protein n=1 Tax=Nocardia gipuzkoensis TaxID=2749991 RepID=UPI00237D3F55|nr:hypothetical protein [Nocardia gipuzkoensis]MDE1673864.1 hypothetical protein [Nocardia gipuzkoensis]